MRKMDMFWKSNREWWTYDDDLMPVVRQDAPPEAHRSYRNYLADVSALHVVNSWKIGEYTVLELEDDCPMYPYNKYWINGVIYDIIPLYDMGDKCIAVKTDQTDMKHQLVKFVLAEQ